jgi:hypothetical protein
MTVVLSCGRMFRADLSYLANSFESPKSRDMKRCLPTLSQAVIYYIIKLDEDYFEDCYDLDILALDPMSQ